MSKGNIRSFMAAHGAQFSALFSLLSIMLIISLMAPNFLTVNNILSILHQVSFVAVLAVGITFLILTGNMDLSASAILALSICIMGDLFVNRGINSVVALLAGLGVALLCGFINGVVVTQLRLVSFIATLATMNVYRGIASVYTEGYSAQGMPAMVKFIGTAKIGIIPVSILVMLLVYAVSWFILTQTSFGLDMQAVGGNLNAAKMSGINVTRVRVCTFVYGSLTAFIAGLILAGRMNTTNPGLATGMEMNCIAAAVIGGTSMHGGIGSVWGTMIGAVIMGVINNGMNQLRVSSFWQQVFLGAILLLSVSIDSLRNARHTR